MQQSHLTFIKNMFITTKNPSMLEVANNGPFIPFPMVL